jgi:hypothetical protein
MQLTMVTMVTAAAVCWLAGRCDDDDDNLEQHLGYIFDVTFVLGIRNFHS